MKRTVLNLTPEQFAYLKREVYKIPQAAAKKIYWNIPIPRIGVATISPSTYEDLIAQFEYRNDADYWQPTFVVKIIKEATNENK